MKMFDMGEYGGLVISAYVISLAFLVVFALMSVAEQRKVKKQIRQIEYKK